MAQTPEQRNKNLARGRKAAHTRKKNLVKRQKEAFLEAYYETGVIARALRAMKNAPCRKSILRWRNSDDEFRQAMEEAKEVSIDVAEDKLQQLIEGFQYEEVTYEAIEMEGQDTPLSQMHKKKVVIKTALPDNASIMFKLKTQGKDRGYIQTNQHLHVVSKLEDVRLPEFMPIKK